MRGTTIFGTDGCGSVSSVTIRDSQVNLLSSILVSTFSAVERLPSDNTLEARINECPPSKDQLDSPKPPLLSKIQERISWRGPENDPKTEAFPKLAAGRGRGTSSFWMAVLDKEMALAPKVPAIVTLRAVGLPLKFPGRISTKCPNLSDH